MLNWFRKGPSPHQTALAMIGAKTGDRVLFAGGDEPGLSAELATITGLNGQTLVVAPAAAQQAVARAAAKAGSLVEFLAQDPGALPALPASVFDVAVWVVSLAAAAPGDRTAMAAALVEALRPGGRIIVIDRPLAARRTGSPATAAQVLGLLAGAGGLAARALATVGRTTYYEARRSR